MLISIAMATRDLLDMRTCDVVISLMRIIQRSLCENEALCSVMSLEERLLL